MRDLLRKLLPGPMRWQATRRQFWREYWLSGEWELRELKRYVDGAKGAIDIGGNAGVYTYHLSRLAKWVRVFEPNPSYAERIAALALPNVTVEQVALSREPGEAELRIPRVADGREDHGMASLEAGAVPDDRLSRSLAVEIRTLDSFGLTDIGFLKIDVEGHEEAALGGAERTIATNRPVILAEIEERHNPGGLDRIAERLGALGYRSYYFKDRIRHPLSSFDAARDQRVGAELDRASHDRRALAYINNFLFLPEGTPQPVSRS